MSATVDGRASAAPEKPKAKGPTPPYTKTGKPRQRYLRELVRALPRERKRLGLGRKDLRAYMRQEDAKREPSAPNARKRLSRQAWRLHQSRIAGWAFRRFNPEGL